LTDYFEGTDPAALTLLECQLTYTCNIRCPYCFNPHHRRVDELSAGEWAEVVRQAADMGTRSCVVNGGEPVTRMEECVAIFSTARERGMTTALSTNGMLLTGDSIAQLAPILDVLQISIHPWRYVDDIAGGIQPFADHVHRFKALGGSRAVFNVVLSKGLGDVLEEVLTTVADLAGDALDGVGVQAAQPYGQGYLNPESIPSAAECHAASAVIERVKVATGLPLLDHVRDYFSVKRNSWGTWGVIVNPAGYVYPMIEGADTLSDLATEVQWDNVRSRALADIWRESAALNAFRGTDWLMEPCTTCEYRDECRGGSRLNAFVLTQDMRRPDPFCVLAPDHGKVMAAYAG
jgi:pyrroloquinoline quinone biosynthesis protein E